MSDEIIRRHIELWADRVRIAKETLGHDGITVDDVVAAEHARAVVRQCEGLSKTEVMQKRDAWHDAMNESVTADRALDARDAAMAVVALDNLMRDLCGKQNNAPSGNV